MDSNAVKTHIFSVIMNRVEAQDDEKRREALAEFMAVTGTAGNTPSQVAELIPPIMHDLYEKWVTLFIDRLMETVDLQNVELLCDGTNDNNAALVLAYIMFMESGRMEKQIAQDLHEHGLKASDDNDLGNLAASYIRNQMTRIAKESNDEKVKGNA